MQSLLLTEYKKLEVVDMPRPEPAADEVLLRVEACGICGSDVHGYDGSSGRRIPPIVMGHEAAGTVAAVGGAVTEWKPGDRVTFHSTLFCGACDYCKRGQLNLCDHRSLVGVSIPEFRRDGAYAEYIAVPARAVYRLPDSLGFPEAAMLEAVSVALHAVKVTELEGGETALVIGAGMIGLLTLQALRVAGVSRILIADIDETRLEQARRLGVDAALRLTGAALVEEVQRLTGGRGVDAVLEAVGRNETVNAGIDALRKGGTITLIGNIQPEVTLPLQKVVTREIRLQGTAAIADEYPQAIELVAGGRIQVKPMISAVAPLAEGPEWFRRLYAHEPGLMKVVLAPGAEGEVR
jgi:L-iditol 2-dehydrogenase